MNMLVTFIFALTALAHAQGQSPENFISIDCGLPENADYTDNKTGINYISDATLVNTGVSHNISSEYNRETLERQFSNLRSFPEGIRNCYTLKPSNGDGKFLIRVRFMYGNYDGQNMTLSFKLMLEADEWDSVEFKDASTVVTKEIIHIPMRNYIDVCLVNTGFGIPFISALELRPIKNSTYQTKSGSLLLFERWDVGTTNNETFRYKDDMFDRIWWPYSSDRWAAISTSKSVGSDESEFKLPSNVMRTGAIPVDPNNFFGLHWKPQDPASKYYLYLYFAEIEPERTNQTREMNIYVNEELWYGPFSPPYLSAQTIFSSSPISGEQNIFSLKKTKNSTLPPILNALEIYQAKEFSQLLTNQQDVDAIMTIKSKYQVKRNWQGDPCAPRVYSWQGLNCSYDDYQSPRIISLNLSSSGIGGVIIPYIFSLSAIESLDLSNNNLTGEVPEFLSELQFLRVLNLSGNNLQGSLPDGLIEKVKNGSLSISVDGNPKLCHLAPCKKRNKKFIILVVAASSVLISVLLAALTILWKLRRKQAGEKKGSLELKSRKFSYSDVLRITNNFERVLGQGGFGTVYHGQLDDTQVAVKMLSPSSVQGYKQFQAEVELLMRAHHKNLTILVGYCDEGTNIGLIYEFMANGNLQAHLIEDVADILSWEGRLRIATEAAQGLEYLHSGCKPPIVHRDVKPANILLNENFQAKLADFGLSRIFPVGGTHVSTTVVGTPGYLDPQYYISNRLTEKSDVYSFGVVLLELISGQPVIQKTNERTHISQWVSFMLAKGDIKNIVDQRLQGDFDTNTVWKIIEVAMTCITPNSTKRPTMNQVVIELNDCLAMEIARTKAHENNENGSNNELMMDLNLQSEVLPLAR